MRLELKGLSDINADLTVLGFSKAELCTLLCPADSMGLTDENETPELSDDVVTRLGDIWCL